jgi:plastocyanin
MRHTRVRIGLAGLSGAALIAGLMVAAAPVAATGPASWNLDAGTGDATGVAALKFYTPAITINAGDTITWKVGGNAHTIAFLTAGQVPPAPDSPAAQAPAGGTTVDGTTFTSSGIVFPAPGHDTFALTFPIAGTYAYHCLIHPGMDGTVTVNAAGTAYPQDQAAITAAATAAEAVDIAAGHVLEQGFSPSSTKNADGTTTYHLAAGVGANRVSILRYIGSTLKIHVGDTVEWTNGDSNGEPHSVSFGTEPQDPSALGPAGGSLYDGKTAWVSSGLFLGAPIPGPHSYSITFTKAGTFKYFCVLHDVVGMSGSVTVAAVAPAPAPATLPPTTTAAGQVSSGDTGDGTISVLLLIGLAGLIGVAAFARRRARAD